MVLVVIDFLVRALDTYCCGISHRLASSFCDMWFNFNKYLNVSCAFIVVPFSRW